MENTSWERPMAGSQDWDRVREGLHITASTTYDGEHVQDSGMPLFTHLTQPPLFAANEDQSNSPWARPQSYLGDTAYPDSPHTEEEQSQRDIDSVFEQMFQESSAREPECRQESESISIVQPVAITPRSISGDQIKHLFSLRATQEPGSLRFLAAIPWAFIFMCVLAMVAGTPQFLAMVFSYVGILTLPQAVRRGNGRYVMWYSIAFIALIVVGQIAAAR